MLVYILYIIFLGKAHFASHFGHFFPICYLRYLDNRGVGVDGEITLFRGL